MVMRIPGPSTKDSGSIPAIRKRGYSSILYAVLYAVVDFGALRVIEAVDCSHEVARDAADAFEAHAFAIEGFFFFSQ